MKLLKLKIGTGFRSLPADFELTFLRDFDYPKLRDFMPYCLVGRNGSGKSNILEVLAWIFYHIECIYLENRPGSFDAEIENGYERKRGFRADRSTPDEFELEYLILLNEKDFTGDFSLLYRTKLSADKPKLLEGDAPAVDTPIHVKIVKEKGLAPVIGAYDIYRAERNSWSVPDRVLLKCLLPQFIIGYSSGENETLSLPFFKMSFLNYDEYEERLIDGRGYNAPEGRLIYLEKAHSQAIFLTNYLMQKEVVLKPVHDTLGIKAITQFRIIINQVVTKTKVEFEDEDLPFAETEETELTEPFELTSQLKQKDTDKIDYKIIDKLIRCATTSTARDGKTLYLDYYIDQAVSENGAIVKESQMKEAFRAMFDNDPLELFRAFQVLLTLNLYDIDKRTKIDLYQSNSLYFNETVPILSSERRAFRFKDFAIIKEHATGEILTKAMSDGEHQFLHAIGLCLLFKNTNSIFLLDEPETHLNPDWRAKFISLLRECLYDSEGGDTYLRELLITSHSPFIVSDCHEENVLVFKKDKDTGIVTANRPGFNTFGASVNKITMQIFGKSETIGNYANSELQELYRRLAAGTEDNEALKDEAITTLGDSIGRTLFIAQASKE